MPFHPAPRLASSRRGWMPHARKHFPAYRWAIRVASTRTPTHRPPSLPPGQAGSGWCVCKKKSWFTLYTPTPSPNPCRGSPPESTARGCRGLPPTHPHASRKIFSCAGHPPTQNAASRTLLSRGKFAGRVGHKVSPQSATHQLGTRLPACRACTMTGPISRWRLTRRPASHACSMTGPIRYRV